VRVGLVGETVTPAAELPIGSTPEGGTMNRGITEIVLPQGCTLIAFTQERNRGVVLAHEPEAARGEEQWITWMIAENSEATGRWDYTFWGHFFDDETDAWNDWINRCMTAGQLQPLRKAKP
jgi:hypothetical protein